ncbi:MAG: 3'-5' exonuclease [Candidatus Gastranaerophilales bacterium]|nr:3'-5' exonuclease [Candidatus Gastranaerophilales bacterium]
MNKILVGLNSAQQEAVSKLSGAMLVLAGAGSGKTKVLTQRIAYLIQNGVSPYEILAVTFTNKAAQEMKERLVSILGEDIVKKLWVGTFHNICGRILRQDIDKYKTDDGRDWRNNFVIFDQDDSLSLIKQAVKLENLDEKMYQPKAVQTNISMAKNKMMDAFKFATNAKDFRTERVSRVYHTYEGMLSTNNALDFDDLLLMSVNLFTKSPEILNKYHSRFKHVLVDEYQDTNLAQYSLINKIYTDGKDNFSAKDRSLCVVGDIDQSIYSWRGADYKIILNFQNDFPDAQLIKLEQNYRSTENILEVANHIIVNNTERLSKKLYSNKGKGEKILCFEANNELEEAHFMIDKIKALICGKYSYNDCVVLYRTNAQSRPIEEAFMARSIPYKMVGGIKFYARKEIKDIIAYLKLVYNPDDSQSLKRVINVPRRAIGPTTIKKIDDISKRESISLFSVLENIEDYSEFSPKTKNSLKGFVNLIKKTREVCGSMPLSEFISQMIDDTEYLDELKEEGTDDANSRIENIQEFISVAKEYESMEAGNDLGDFLTQISLVSDLDSLEESAESVTLMTLHAAKGLEFPVVFLAGLEEGIFPHSRSLNINAEMEEERRLMYVGVTRAEDLLYLTYTKKRLIWGDYKYCTPSRFLKEIPQNLIVTNYAREKEEKSSYSSTKSGSWGYSKSNDRSNSFGKDFKSPGFKESPLQNDYSKGFGSNFVAPKFKDKNIQNDCSKGFGSGFVAPKYKKTEEAKTQKIEVKLHKLPEQKKPEKIISGPQLPDNLKAFLKQKEVSTPQKVEIDIFNEGERVFHEKYGIGIIAEVLEMGQDVMYSVDFGKLGKKPLDARFSKLKKF